MSHLHQWLPSRHQELPLDRVAEFPHLESVLAEWRRNCIGIFPPPRLSPAQVPKAALPYVMLLDLEDDARLRVRLAGTYVCESYGRELKGRTTDDFFHEKDAAKVVDSALEVARTGVPSLARRTYITLNDRYWSYVRLIMPLSRSGDRIDGFFKLLEPGSLHGWDADESEHAI